MSAYLIKSVLNKLNVVNRHAIKSPLTVLRHVWCWLEFHPHHCLRGEVWDQKQVTGIRPLPFVFNLRKNFDEIRAHEAPNGEVFYFNKLDASCRRQCLEDVNSSSRAQNYHRFWCYIIDINSNSDSVLNHFHNLVTGAIESNFKKYVDNSRGSFPYNHWFDIECQQLKLKIHPLY